MKWKIDLLPSTFPPLMKRLVGLQAAAVIAVAFIVGRLFLVQVVWHDQLVADGENTRRIERIIPGRRGTIEDHAGRPLAYTFQAKTLTVSPNRLRQDLTTIYETQMRNLRPGQSEPPTVDEQLISMAHNIASLVAGGGIDGADVDPQVILDKLRANSDYEVLVANVDPDLAMAVSDEYASVSADRQDRREYPNGPIGENIIGKTSWDNKGQSGLEASFDAKLAGIDGSYSVEISPLGQRIPGTEGQVVQAINGATVRLTLDSDLQNYVQQQVEQAKVLSGAQSAEAVVLDAKSGKVLAMANSDTIDPNGDIGKQLDEGKTFDNPSISSPFEPGSVAKIITAAAAIEDGKTNPDEVITVPGSIDMDGVNVRDAWVHGDVQYTTTGIFGKSSNVGTLILADRVGRERFSQMLKLFGLGQLTGIELPNESPGQLLELSQWDGGKFANLPIGQGMSMTTLQMAGIYQAIANDGVRIQPRIVDSITKDNGEKEVVPEPEHVRVISPETAATLRNMFQAVTQSDPTGVQQGTGHGAAVPGYQIAGKTGTAQQVDPACNCYSNSRYWITFAGIAPADNPRFVVAIMLDRPVRGVHGEGGQSAAPLFHDIATWLLDHDNVPLSPPREEPLILQP